MNCNSEWKCEFPLTNIWGELWILTKLSKGFKTFQTFPVFLVQRCTCTCIWNFGSRDYKSCLGVLLLQSKPVVQYTAQVNLASRENGSNLKRSDTKIHWLSRSLYLHVAVRSRSFLFSQLVNIHAKNPRHDKTLLINLYLSKFLSYHLISLTGSDIAVNYIE